MHLKQFLIFLSFSAFVVHPASYADAETPNACGTSEVTIFEGGFEVERRIISNPVDSESCSQASIVTHIFLDEKLVHANATPLKRLTVYGEETSPALLKGFLAKPGQKPFIIKAENVPNWMPDDEMFDEHNLWTGITKDRYQQVRAPDADLLCYSVHYENFECIQMAGDAYFVIIKGGA